MVKGDCVLLMLSVVSGFGVALSAKSALADSAPPCHWMDITRGLGSPPVDALAVEGEAVAFASGAGVHSSEDSGRRWRRLNAQHASSPPLWGPRADLNLLHAPPIWFDDDGARSSDAAFVGEWPLDDGRARGGARRSSAEGAQPESLGASGDEVAQRWTALMSDGRGGWVALDGRRLAGFSPQGRQREILGPSQAGRLSGLARAEGVTLLGSERGVWRRLGRGRWRVSSGGPVRVERVAIRGVHAVAISQSGGFESFDAGVTWRRLPSLPGSTVSWRAVALGEPEGGMSPGAGWSIWVGAGEAVWRLDGDGRWRRVGSGARLGVVRDVKVLPAVGVVAATSRGIWRLAANHEWVPWGVGLEGRSVRRVGGQAPTRLGWIVGTSRGLWACTLAEAVEGRRAALNDLVGRWRQEPPVEALLSMAREAHAPATLRIEGEALGERLEARGMWPRVSLVGALATGQGAGQRWGSHRTTAWRQASADFASDVSLHCVLSWDLRGLNDARPGARGVGAQRALLSALRGLERRVAWLAAARRHAQWERAAWGFWASPGERLKRCVMLSSLTAELEALVTKTVKEGGDAQRSPLLVHGCGGLGAESEAMAVKREGDTPGGDEGGESAPEAVEGGEASASDGAEGLSEPDRRWRAVMSHFEHEPDVRSTQAAVLAYARLEPWRVEDFGRRARWAHLAPVAIEGRAQTTRGRDDRFSTREELDEGFRVVDTQTSTVGADEGQNRLWVGVRWDLSRLVFNPDELDVAAQSGREVRLRQELLSEVTRVYFERRSLQVERLLTPPARRAELVRLQLRIDGLTAELDAMTGAWFSAHIRPRSGAVTP